MGGSTTTTVNVGVQHNRVMEDYDKHAESIATSIDYVVNGTSPIDQLTATVFDAGRLFGSIYGMEDKYLPSGTTYSEYSDEQTIINHIKNLGYSNIGTSITRAECVSGRVILEDAVNNLAWSTGGRDGKHMDTNGDLWDIIYAGDPKDYLVATPTFYYTNRIVNRAKPSYILRVQYWYLKNGNMLTNSITYDANNDLWDVVRFTDEEGDKTVMLPYNSVPTTRSTSIVSRFMPILSIRENLIFTSDRGGYLKTKQDITAQAMGLSVQDLEKSITDNNQQGYISAAAILFNIPLDTQTQANIKYLYSYFNAIDISNHSDSNVSNFIIECKDNPYNITVKGKMEISNVKGVIGAVGTYTNEVTYDSDYIDGKGDGYLDVAALNGERDFTVCKLRWQYSSTYYKEIHIKNTVSVTIVSLGYYVNAYTRTGLVYIPLSLDYIEGLSPREKIILYTEGLDFLMYTVQLVENKGKSVVTFIVSFVVQVALAILTIGTSIPASIAYAAAMQIAFLVLNKLLTSLNISSGLKAVLSVVVAVAMMTQGDFSNLLNLNLLHAAQLVGITSNAYSLYTGEKLKEGLTAIDKATEALTTDYEAKEAELAELAKDQELVGLTTAELTDLIVEESTVYSTDIFSYNSKIDTALGELLYDQQFIFDQIENTYDTAFDRITI